MALRCAGGEGDDAYAALHNLLGGQTGASFLAIGVSPRGFSAGEVAAREEADAQRAQLETLDPTRTWANNEGTREYQHDFKSPTYLSVTKGAQRCCT